MKAEWTNKDSLSIESTGQKAILVIDMPNNCSECPCCNENLCGNQYKGYIDDYLEWNSGRPSWCPLRPLPQKKVGYDLYERYGSWTLSDEKEVSYRVGFNDCLEEILGEEEYEQLG